MARRAARFSASVSTWSTWYPHAIRPSVLARPVRMRSPAARQARRITARHAAASSLELNLPATVPSRRSISTWRATAASWEPMSPRLCPMDRRSPATGRACSIGTKSRDLGMRSCNGADGANLQGLVLAPVRVGPRSRGRLASADLLGQGDDDARGAAKVAEQDDTLELRYTAREIGAVGAPPSAGHDGPRATHTIRA